MAPGKEYGHWAHAIQVLGPAPAERGDTIVGGKCKCQVAVLPRGGRALESGRAGGEEEPGREGLGSVLLCNARS